MVNDHLRGIAITENRGTLVRMRICVLGVGGVGGYFGGRLAAAGNSVAFTARGNTLKALRRDGLRVESPLGDIHLPEVEVAEDPGEVGRSTLSSSVSKRGKCPR